MVIPILMATYNLNKRLLLTLKMVLKIPTIGFHHGKEPIIAIGKELVVKGFIISIDHHNLYPRENVNENWSQKPKSDILRHFLGWQQLEVTTNLIC